MRKLKALAWMSLDGIFDAESMPLWFFPYDSLERQTCIREIITDCDTMLYGRVTYEMLCPFWSQEKDDTNGPAHHLNNVKKYVVSSTMKTASWTNSIIIKNNVADDVRNLKQQNGGNILIDGSGILVNFLLEENLIDELHLLIHPAVMGKGKRYFNKNIQLTDMTVLENKVMDKGVSLVVLKLAENH